MIRRAARALHAIAALALFGAVACSDDAPAASSSPTVTTPVPAGGATAGAGGAGAGGASGAGSGAAAAGSGGTTAPVADAGASGGGAGMAAMPTCRVPDNPAFTDADADGGVAPDCYDVPRRIIAENCIGGFCHNARPGTAGGLNLMSPCIADRLLDVRSRCEGLLLVDRADPERSFLLDKLQSEKPRCGASMPDGWHLPPDQVACMNAWVHAIVRASH